MYVSELSGDDQRDTQMGTGEVPVSPPARPTLSTTTDGEDPTVSDESSITMATQGGITLVGDVVKKSFGFLIIAIITRLVSPSIYGLFVLGTSVILFVQVFATLGLPKAIDYYVPQFLAADEPAKARGVVLQVVAFTIGTSVGTAIALSLLADRLALWFGEPSLRIALILLAVALPLLAAFNVLLAIFNAIKQLQYRVYVRDIARPTVRLVATAALLVGGFGLIGVVGGYIIGLLACIVVGGVLLSRNVGFLFGTDVEFISTPKLLWYAVPLAFAGVIYVVLGQIDYVIVGFFLASEDVGFYRVGYMLAENLFIFFAALAPVFKPLIAEVRADDDAVRAQYQTAVRWVLALTLPVLVVVVLGASTYLSIVFTPQYEVAAPVVAVLAGGYIVSIAGGGPGGSLLQGLGYSRLVFFNTGLLLVTNIVVSVLLVPRIGILGAGIGSAAALSVAGGAALIELYVLRRIHPFTNRLGRVVAASLPAALVGGLIVLVVPNLYVVGVLLPIVVVSAYLAGLLGLNAVTDADLRVAGEIDPRFQRGLRLLRR